LVTGSVSEKFASSVLQEGADVHILKDKMNQLPSVFDTSVKKQKEFKKTAAYKFGLDQSSIADITNMQFIINENKKDAHSMGTPDFETSSLEEQLLSLTRKMFALSELKVVVDSLDLDERLMNIALKLTVYCIAREQYSNILKYANARNVYISMHTGNQKFEMSFADDGDGMEQYSLSGGIGLRNIRNRLRVFNGRSKITTSEGNGFVLEIAVPLLNADH
jgi:glucose-6-phosphate-specific signal transduction histidine kinase